MEPNIFQQWWALHLRKVRGEKLDDRDQVFYEETLRQLHHSEEFINNLAAAKEALISVETELGQLQRRREKLDAEIANLEAALNAHTKQLQGVKD